jgi:hypothetical protein
MLTKLGRMAAVRTNHPEAMARLIAAVEQAVEEAGRA